MRGISLGFCLLLLGLMPYDIGATDYYFANAGSDGNNCTSTGTACQTVARLADFTASLSPGDTVNLNRGDTFSNLSRFRAIYFLSSGVFSNPIILQAYGSGAKPILDCVLDTGHGIEVGPTHGWIDIRDMDVRGCRQNYEFHGAHDINLIDVVSDLNNGFGAFRISTNSYNFVLDGVEVVSSEGECVYLGVSGAGGPDDQTHDITIKNSRFNDCGAEGSESKIGVYNVTIQNNVFSNSLSGFPNTNNFGVTLAQSGNLVENNLFFNIGLAGIQVRGNGEYRNNIIVDASQDSSTYGGIRVFETATTELTSVLIEKNTIVSAGGACISDASGDADVTIRDNICWLNLSGNDADPLFVAFSDDGDVSNDDFNLQVGSPAIAAATDGLDRGAHQPPFIPDATACEIGAVTASTFVANWSNPTHPPLSAVTDGSLTIKYNAVAKTHSGGTVIQGTNQTRTTMDSAAVAEAITFDALYGAAEGTGIGTSTGGQTPHTSKSRVITAQACTNNVGAGAPTLTQLNTRTVRFRGPAGSSPFKAAENASKTIRPGGCVRGIFQWECDAVSPAACPTQGYRARVSKNGGAYGDVPDTCSTGTACLFQNHPDVANLTATAQRLSACTTFVPGAFVDNQTAVPSYALGIDECVEAEYPICVAADVAVGDTFTFRIYTDAGDALGTYTQDLELIVATPPHHIQQGGVARSGGGLVQ